MGKEVKKLTIVFISILVVLLVVSIVSASWWENIKKTISGKATQTVSLNITVGGPAVITVYNDSIDVTSGPNTASRTDVIVNFTVYSPSGAGNLNDSTALANISSAGELRSNSSCQETASAGDYANYSCNITMWWWDVAGTWTINAYIEDDQDNSAINTSMVFTVGSNTAFAMSPAILTWSGIASGATNQTSNNDPLLLNNTGNDPISAGSIKANSSNLRGETTSAEALWAGNFSMAVNTGGACSGADCIECEGSAMVRGALTAVGTSNLSKGNYTINNGTAQEQLYVCLRLAGSELSTQAYSTANETEWAWIIDAS